MPSFDIRAINLEQYSYVQVVDWLQNPTTLLAAADEATAELDDDTISGDLRGTSATLVAPPGYLQRNSAIALPSLESYEGARGREFATSNPRMGIIDFLAVDRDGNFVRSRSGTFPTDGRWGRSSVTWDGSAARLATGCSVRGMLVAGDVRRAAHGGSSVPNLESGV